MEISASPQLIGIYRAENIPDVYLIELIMNIHANDVDVSSFTQRDDSIPKEDWQVAYDEHFLNEDGTKVIGTFIDHSKLAGAKTRVAFFMYFVDIGKPLISQYGETLLSEPTPMPERFVRIFAELSFYIDFAVMVIYNEMELLSTAQRVNAPKRKLLKQRQEVRSFDR